MSNPTLIKGATVLAAADTDPKRKDILIKDRRIAEIEDHGLLDRNEPAARTIDGRGKLVIPGFVNAHYHSHDVLSGGMFEEMPL